VYLIEVTNEGKVKVLMVLEGTDFDKILFFLLEPSLL
jgi:hypothetical protein